MGNGIKDVAGKIASLDFEGAAESANRLVTLSKNINFGDAVKGIKDIGSTFLSLGKALLTNPLFLIAGAIALAVTYSKELLTLIDGVSGEDEKRLETLKKQASASKEQLDSISAQEETLKANGKSEEEILQLKIDQAEVATKAAVAQVEQQKKIRDEQVAAAERNKKILTGIIQFVTIPLQALLYGVDQLTEGLNAAGIISDETFATIGNLRNKFNEGIAELVFNPEETKKKGDEEVKAAEKAAIELQNTLDGYRNKQKADRAKDAKEAADAQKAINDKRLADEIAARQAFAKANQDAQENELYELQLAAEKQLADFTGSEETRLLLIESYALREQQILDKYDQIAADADIKAKEEQAARDKKAADDAAEAAEKAAADQIALNEKIKLAEQNLADAKFSIASGAITIAGELAKKNKKVQDAIFIAEKAFAIARIVVDTQREIAGIAATNAALGPAGIPLTISQTAAAKIRAGIGIATIAATTIGKFIGGGAGAGAVSGGGGSVGGASAGSASSVAAQSLTPTFGLFGQGNQLNNINGQGANNGQQNMAINVSVSETEITSTQNFVNKVRESSVL